MTVLDAFTQLVRHPREHLIERWNWKSAVLSAILRGTIFFTVNLAEGWPAAVRALGVDAPFRLLVAGFFGAIIQAFRKAQPPWAAFLTTAVVLVLLTHGLEFLVHTLAGTPRLRASITASIAVSALSAVVNLFLMRHGVLVVGGEGRPLLEDLRQLPRVVGALVHTVWKAIAGGGRAV